MPGLLIRARVSGRIKLKLGTAHDRRGIAYDVLRRGLDGVRHHLSCRAFPFRNDV